MDLHTTRRINAMNEYINISQIESWLQYRMAQTVCDNVFAGSLPSTLERTWNEMATVEVVDLKDRTEYGRVRGEALVNVFCYVRPISNGHKDVAAMNRIETALIDLIENDRDEHYSMTEMYSNQGYDKTIGYHYKITALKLQIF